MAVAQLLAFFLAGCAAQSQFIPAPPSGTPNGSTAYPQPDKKVLVIYNHGSTEEYRWDQCRPHGSTTPESDKRTEWKAGRGA